MVIDFHTHIFPEKIAKRAIQSLEDNMLRANGKREYAYLDGTVSGLLASMEEQKIDMSVIMPIATTVKQAPSINAFAKEINSNYKNLISFGSVNPHQSDWEQVLEGLAENGFLGIKLHPEYQEFYICSDESIRIINKCEELGLLVLLHTGEDKGVLPPRHCTPKMLAQLLNYTDGHNVIAAHMGGLFRWEEVCEYLLTSPYYFDTSYSLGHMSRETAEKIITAHGADKILYGSDSPWEEQAKNAKILKELNLSDEDKDKILYKNALRLLKIGKEFQI